MTMAIEIYNRPTASMVWEKERVREKPEGTFCRTGPTRHEGHEEQPRNTDCTKAHVSAAACPGGLRAGDVDSIAQLAQAFGDTQPTATGTGTRVTVA